MKIKTIVSPSACEKYVKESYTDLFAGKTTMCAKIKNSRIRAVRDGGCTVFMFRTYHPSEKFITVHCIKLSDNAVDAMQMLKNKIERNGINEKS